MNDQVKVIQQMMSSVSRTSNGASFPLGASTSAKFDKATLGSTSKVRDGSLTVHEKGNEPHGCGSSSAHR